MMRNFFLAAFILAAVSSLFLQSASSQEQAETYNSCRKGLAVFERLCRQSFSKNVQRFQDCVIYRMQMLRFKFRNSYRLLSLDDFYCIGKPRSCRDGVRLTKEACFVQGRSGGAYAYRKCLNTVMNHYGYDKGADYMIMARGLICTP